MEFNIANWIQALGSWGVEDWTGIGIAGALLGLFWKNPALATEIYRDAKWLLKRLGKGCAGAGSWLVRLVLR